MFLRRKGENCHPLRDDSLILHRKTLQLSRQLRDQAVEAQACYSLGNTYTLLQDYERAAEYHLRHLVIAQELADRCVGARPWRDWLTVGRGPCSPAGRSMVRAASHQGSQPFPQWETI